MNEEIDRRITEEVMNECWHLWDGIKHERMGGPIRPYMVCGKCGGEMLGWEPKHYSTDIQATWSVVEKLGEKRPPDKAGWWLLLKQIAGVHPTWCAEFTFGGMAVEPIPRHHAEADTAPLAICLAALEAGGK